MSALYPPLLHLIIRHKKQTIDKQHKRATSCDLSVTTMCACAPERDVSRYGWQNRTKCLQSFIFVCRVFISGHRITKDGGFFRSSCGVLQSTIHWIRLIWKCNSVMELQILGRFSSALFYRHDPTILQSIEEEVVVRWMKLTLNMFNKTLINVRFVFCIIFVSHIYKKNPLLRDLWPCKDRDLFYALDYGMWYWVFWFMRD